MSYILEALRKMEGRKQRDPGPQSWVEELSASPEGEAPGRKSPGRLLVAASIFFGVSGILIGLFFYSAHQEGAGVRGVGTKPAAIVHSNPAPAGDTSAAEAAGQAPRKAKETGRQPVETASRGVTLSDLRPEAPVKAPPTPKPAPVTPLPVAAAETPDKLPVPEPPRIVDITNRYRLTSTGEVNNRKCATIDRKDYFEGDAFLGGMTVSRIDKDRVFLKGKESGTEYVIIFRYRGR